LYLVHSWIRIKIHDTFNKCKLTFIHQIRFLFNNSYLFTNLSILWCSNSLPCHYTLQLPKYGILQNLLFTVYKPKNIIRNYPVSKVQRPAEIACILFMRSLFNKTFLIYQVNYNNITLIPKFSVMAFNYEPQFFKEQVPPTRIFLQGKLLWNKNFYTLSMTQSYPGLHLILHGCITLAVFETTLVPP